MAFYFFIFFILGVFSFLENFYALIGYNKYLFYLFSFALFCMSFLRWETGTDWSAYVYIFNRSTEWLGDGEFEWGFARLNEIVKIVFDNYNVLLFIFACLLFYLQTKSIATLSIFPITALFVLWSISFGNVFFIRQSIATVILFYSVQYIQRGSPFKFLLAILFAFSFHRSSLVFLLAWPFYKMEIKTWIYIVGIVLSVVMTVLVSHVLSSLGGLMGGIFLSRVETYTTTDDLTFGSQSSLTEIMVRGFANKLFIFGLVLVNFNKNKKLFSELKGYLNLYWLSILIYFSTISISIAFIRFSFAFDMFSILLIPILLNGLKSGIARFITFTLIFTYCAARMYISINGSYYDLFVPFKTILFK